MPQAGQNPDAIEVNKCFQQRKVVAIVGNPPAIAFRQTSPEISAKLGVALAPGPTYVGGSSLIIWRNSRQPDEAVALVRHLTSHEVQLKYARRTGFLPARSSALNDGYFREDPQLSVFAQSVLQGRTYVNLRMSGLIEDMLSNVISHVWSKIIADPLTDVKSALMGELEPIVRRVSLWAE
jgi:ABC-type glycerol-3-phosphate transport system substrate-binding protein